MGSYQSGLGEQKMSLYKRGAVWWIRFTAPDGREIRETSSTADRRQAQEYHDRRKAEYWRVAKLAERRRYTWQEAVVRWLTKRSHTAWGAAARSWLAEVHPVLGSLYLDEITPQIIAQIRAAKIATGVKPATVNRFLAVLRSVLNTARKEGWIDTVPAFQLRCCAVSSVSMSCTFLLSKAAP